MLRTSARLWVMKIIARRRSAWRPRSSSTMTACTETSSADVTSSHTSRSGSTTSARAMATRCRSPPDSWSGYLLRPLPGARRQGRAVERDVPGPVAVQAHDAAGERGLARAGFADAGRPNTRPTWLRACCSGPICGSMIPQALSPRLRAQGVSRCRSTPRKSGVLGCRYRSRPPPGQGGLVERSDHGESGNALDRRQFLRGLAATGAIAGTGSLLAACSSSGTSSPAASPASTAKRKGGSLKVGLTGGSGSDTLDPHKGLTYLDTARAQSLYQPLLQLTTAAQTEFVLAEDISPRGSTSQWVISLRPGITFHDGKPLTADDVIFTLRRILGGGNPKLALTGHTSLGPVDLKGLKALDKHTVLVPMTSPYGSFLDQLAYWYYLYIVPVGFDPKTPNGTGAFKYQSFTPGQRSVFVRNSNYWKSGLPYVDTLTIIDFSDATSLQNALTTGVIHGAGAMEGPQIAELQSAGGVHTVVSHTGAITPFTMRVDQAPFNDVNVRQAMRLLVDRH